MIGSNVKTRMMQVSLFCMSALSFGLLLMSCSDNSQAGVTIAEEASVSGTLKNAQGEPIEGARVYAYQVALLRDSADAGSGYIAEATSDADGNYTLAGVQNTISLKFQQAELDLAAFREGLGVEKETQLDLTMRELKQITISLPDYSEADPQALISLDSQSTVAFLDGNLWVIHSVSGEDEIALSDSATGSSLLVSQASSSVVKEGEEVGSVLDIRTIDIVEAAGNSSVVGSSSSASSSSSEPEDVSSSSGGVSSLGLGDTESCVELSNNAPQCTGLSFAPAVAICPGKWTAIDTLNKTDGLYRPDTLVLSFAHPEWTVLLSADSAGTDKTYFGCGLNRDGSDFDLVEGILNPGNISYRLYLVGDILVEMIRPEPTSALWDTSAVYQIKTAEFLD